MAESNLQRDFKLTKAEREKEIQAEAYGQLHQEWPLPNNLSELKSFAFGSLTWRDMLFVGASELIPVVLMLPFSSLIPQWLCVVIGIVIGLPFSFLSMKHVFTGDLPFEERVKIALNDHGKINLLNWDKTKKPNGEYVDTSTQSFVPQMEFSEKNYAILPRNEGGFAVIELSVDDMSQSKSTDVLGTVNSFKRLLDALIQENEAIPIQIMLKSVPKNLSDYIDIASQRSAQIAMKNKQVASARADNYTELLMQLDQDKAFYYRYYIIVTYREDAEHVGENTMNTVSVKRAKIREKGMNPLNKKAKLAQQTEFDVGMSMEERKQALRELNRDAEFGKKRTTDALERRVNMVVNMLRDLGSTHTAVKPRVLSSDETAKLIFECCNMEDKNVVDSVLTQALEPKDTLYSENMYKHYPELFQRQSTTRDRTLEAQRAGALLGFER